MSAPRPAFSRRSSNWGIARTPPRSLFHEAAVISLRSSSLTSQTPTSPSLLNASKKNSSAGTWFWLSGILMMIRTANPRFSRPSVASRSRGSPGTASPSRSLWIFLRTPRSRWFYSMSPMVNAWETTQGSPASSLMNRRLRAWRLSTSCITGGVVWQWLLAPRDVTMPASVSAGGVWLCVRLGSTRGWSLMDRLLAPVAFRLLRL